MKSASTAPTPDSAMNWADPLRCVLRNRRNQSADPYWSPSKQLGGLARATNASEPLLWALQWSSPTALGWVYFQQSTNSRRQTVVLPGYSLNSWSLGFSLLILLMLWESKNCPKAANGNRNAWRSKRCAYQQHGGGRGERWTRWLALSSLSLCDTALEQNKTKQNCFKKLFLTLKLDASSSVTRVSQL